MPFAPLLALLALLAGPRQVELRIEHFVLERDGRAVAASRLVHRRAGERRVLEWEFHHADGSSAMLVEVREEGLERLVWREPGPHAPTWMVELRPPDGEVRETLWGLGTEPHRRSRPARLPRMPLDLLEEARAGRLPAGVVPVLRPPTMGTASLVVECRAPVADEDLGEGVRVLCLRDPAQGEDPAAWSFALAGERCLALRLRQGGPWWRAATAEEWAWVRERAARVRAGAGIERPE